MLVKLTDDRLDDTSRIRILNCYPVDYCSPDSVEECSPPCEPECYPQNVDVCLPDMCNPLDD